jgi:hypothetical protein
MSTLMSKLTFGHETNVMVDMKLSGHFYLNNMGKVIKCHQMNHLDVCSILLARASSIDWHTHNQGTQKDGLMKKNYKGLFWIFITFTIMIIVDSYMTIIIIMSC